MSENQKPAVVTDTVLQKINTLQESKELQLPANYSAANALKAAWLYLQDVEDKDHKRALDVCSRESISTALFNMVTQGLSVAKKQCYFVVYGKELQFVPSYFGTLAVAKRTAGVKKAVGNVVYKNDEFKYSVDLESGCKKITKHEQSIENIDNNNIVGAYAIVTFEDGTTKAEIMPITQIRQAWLQGKARGNSPAHKNFPDQMAVRTVINRALKIENASADDSHLALDDDGSTETKTAIAPSSESPKAIEDVNIQDAEVVDDKKTETPAPESPKSEQPEAPKTDEPAF